MHKPESFLQALQGKSNVYYFANGEVNNRVVSFPGPAGAPLLVFVANWRAKLKHWKSFIKVLQQKHRVLYFETREKEATQYRTEAPDLSVTAMAEDLTRFLNLVERPYHLLGVSVGTSVILRSWAKLTNKPESLILLCPVLKVKMPAYFRVFPFIDIKTFTRYAPLLYRLLCVSPRLKSVQKTLRRAMTEKDFTEIAVMKASVQQLLTMPDPLACSNCRPTGRTLIVRSLQDPLHSAADADRVMQGIGATDAFSCPDFRSVHAAETAERLLPFLRRESFVG
ncbi:alpha/beta fold hydrolase [Neolewinella agarilytica]|uniref:Pimeloyl-ACP methyl ester carboxylesterase n=1 Tax=Neolewinella agarilytica TaxID=478744 RepID=A0A1H9G406_9BACT|nr:alpha/beta hydrolase [Neolewinella agarilytica]SEQ44733.1 Pimeloyl-ACP methyl ester carboxylesterase [Neolewinella agarilytica]